MPWEIVPVSMMKLTLSADHRIANERDGALYMAEVKRVLERTREGTRRWRSVVNRATMERVLARADERGFTGGG